MSSATRRPGIELEAGAATKVLLGSYPTQRQIIYIYLNIYTYILQICLYTLQRMQRSKRGYTPAACRQRRNRAENGEREAAGQSRVEGVRLSLSLLGEIRYHTEFTEELTDS